MEVLEILHTGVVSAEGRLPLGLRLEPEEARDPGGDAVGRRKQEALEVLHGLRIVAADAG